MKQLFISKDVAYATGVDYNDVTQVPEGALAFFNLTDGSLISSSATMKGNFAVVLGRGENKMPLHFPEVDYKSLVVERGEYTEGATFTAAITVPTTEKGKIYTIVLAKHGVVFNERNTWTYTAMAKSDVAADVAAEIVKTINANTITSGLKAENSGGKITVTAVNEGDNFTLVGADELTGIEPIDVTEGVKTMLDKAYIQDLASRCAAGKGFNYLGEDGAEIYPGYPETVDADEYVLYSLRFAVPRVAAKTRDEVVSQILHLAVPKDAPSVATLDGIFGTTAKLSLAGNGIQIPCPDGVDCPEKKDTDGEGMKLKV